MTADRSGDETDHQWLRRADEAGRHRWSNDLIDEGAFHSTIGDVRALAAKQKIDVERMIGGVAGLLIAGCSIGWCAGPQGIYFVVAMAAIMGGITQMDTSKG